VPSDHETNQAYIHSFVALYVANSRWICIAEVFICTSCRTTTSLSLRWSRVPVGRLHSLRSVTSLS